MGSINSMFKVLILRFSALKKEANLYLSNIDSWGPQRLTPTIISKLFLVLMAIWVLFHLLAAALLLTWPLVTTNANLEGNNKNVYNLATLHIAFYIIHLLVWFIYVCVCASVSNVLCGGWTGDALYALRRAVKDPKNVLQSWDPTLVDPCTWFHVTCDSESRVTRL